MKYELYANIIGAGLFIIGFISMQIMVVLLGLSVLLGTSLVQFYKVLKVYLPATLGGEKPPTEYSLTTLLGVFTQALAVFALITRFAFWEINPQTMRSALYLYVPMLLVLLIQLRIITTTQMFTHYRNLLLNALIAMAVTFLFFLTPEKKLAQHFYKQQPEKLKSLLAEIEKRTPKPKKKENKTTQPLN